MSQNPQGQGPTPKLPVSPSSSMSHEDGLRPVADISRSSEILRSFRKQLLSWEDVLFLAENSLALRHVTDKEKLQGELLEGIQTGDALSLANPQVLLRADDLPENLDQGMRQKLEIARRWDAYDCDFRHWRLSLIPEELQPIVLLRFVDALKSFLRASIDMDLRYRLFPWHTVADTTKLLESKVGGFLLVEFEGAKIPYDHKNYPLGKCGGHSVTPDKIKGVVYMDGLIEYLNDTTSHPRIDFNEASSKEMTECLVDRATDYLWMKLASLIRTNRDEQGT